MNIDVESANFYKLLGKVPLLQLKKLPVFVHEGAPEYMWPHFMNAFYVPGYELTWKEKILLEETYIEMFELFLIINYDISREEWDWITDEKVRNVLSQLLINSCE